MHVERIFKRSKPLGTRRGAPLPAGVEWKPQRLDQAHHLGSRSDVGKAWTRPQHHLIQIVQSGQAAWEKLAVDQPLGKPVHTAKSKPGR